MNRVRENPDSIAGHDPAVLEADAIFSVMCSMSNKFSFTLYKNQVICK